MKNDYREILKKIKFKLNIEKDSSLANTMGVKQTTFSSWKNRNTIDFNILVDFCRKNNISIDWLFDINSQNSLSEPKSNELESLRNRIEKLEREMNNYLKETRMNEEGISKELSAFNQQILTLNLLNVNLEALFTKSYDIRSELSIIDSFLNHYFYLASSRIILILSSIYDNHDKYNKEQLTFSYFISDKENPLYEKFVSLKSNHRLQYINKHRNNLIGHINLDANIDKSKFLSRYKLFNNDIYNFTIETVNLAKELNTLLNNPGMNFTIINPSSDGLKLLAEEYNLLDKHDIISLRLMKRNNSELFNKIKEQIHSLIETNGY